MNLREFLNYRSTCLCCGHDLSSFFQAHKKQKHRFEDGRFVAIFQMKGIKKNQKSYRVGYSVGLDDNSFRIEFYDQDDVTYYDTSPLWLISRFKKFHQNVNDHKIIRHCSVCKQYYYESDVLQFDFSKGRIDDFGVKIEWCKFTQPTANEHKIYNVHNWFDTNKSWITIYKSGTADGYSVRAPEPISIPLISMSSIQDLKKRIDNIMPFA